MYKLIISSIFIMASATASFAAEFGDLASTYTGTTAKGGDIVIVVPKSGMPTYRFRGSPVMVSNAKLSGKTITLNVGPSGMGKIVLGASGKSMSYKYSEGQGNTTASLTKQ